MRVLVRYQLRVAFHDVLFPLLGKLYLARQVRTGKSHSIAPPRPRHGCEPLAPKGPRSGEFTSPFPTGEFTSPFPTGEFTSPFPTGEFTSPQGLLISFARHLSLVTVPADRASS